VVRSQVHLPSIAGACLILAASTSSATPPTHSVDVDQVVQRWVQATRADLDLAIQYGYRERIHDDDGTKTYDVILIDGSPFKRLVSIDDRPLPHELARKEEQRFERAKAERADESPDEKAERLADYRKDFARAHRILEQMPRAFQYTLQSTQKIGARKAYVLHAVPRKSYDPPSIAAEVLTGMQGQFWIDTKSYQLIRAVAHVLKSVTIDGFLATVQPGTEFELEQKAIAPGLWLPTHFQIRSHSRILFFFPHHIDQDRTFSNYRRESSPPNINRHAS